MHHSKLVDLRNTLEDVQDPTRDNDFMWKYSIDHIPKAKSFESFCSKCIRRPSEAFTGSLNLEPHGYLNN